jgi:hypothetical protein
LFQIAKSGSGSIVFASNSSLFQIAKSGSDSIVLHQIPLCFKLPKVELVQIVSPCGI